MPLQKADHLERIGQIPLAQPVDVPDDFELWEEFTCRRCMRLIACQSSGCIDKEESAGFQRKLGKRLMACWCVHRACIVNRSRLSTKGLASLPLISEIKSYGLLSCTVR